MTDKKTEWEHILLIMSCYKYENRANKQRITWLTSLPSHMKYYHVIGDKEKVSENNCKNGWIDNDKKILYVATEDDYNSLPHKVIMAYKVINELFNYKYIYKTDDDQTLIQQPFFSSITRIVEMKGCHYGGFPVKVRDHISSYFTVHDCLPRDLFLKKCTYCNGRFYFLSKEAVENVLLKIDIISKQFIEDHAIGLNLDEKYKENMLTFDTKKIFMD